ncbi:hypothetical protein J2X69_001320 [Algoriphagus sp. 4150]|nr:hypothetical protein [Algoriphagus sp. 4150]
MTDLNWTDKYRINDLILRQLMAAIELLMHISGLRICQLSIPNKRIILWF